MKFSIKNFSRHKTMFGGFLFMLCYCNPSISDDLTDQIIEWAGNKINTCIVNNSRNTMRMCSNYNCKGCLPAAGNGEYIVSQGVIYPYICRGSGSLDLVGPPAQYPFSQRGQQMGSDEGVLIELEGYNSSATSKYTEVSTVYSPVAYRQCIVDAVQALISRQIAH